MGMIIIIDLIFIFLIIGIIIKLINIYVKTKENINKIKQYNEEKKAKTKNDIDNWVYNPETKKFEKKEPR